jgi:hypothetical protein
LPSVHSSLPCFGGLAPKSVCSFARIWP